MPSENEDKSEEPDGDKEEGDVCGVNSENTKKRLRPSSSSSGESPPPPKRAKVDDEAVRKQRGEKERTKVLEYLAQVRLDWRRETRGGWWEKPVSLKY